ncbi:hypothetical protein HPB48_020718 [Haemaphysalis longicornis]|uniref:Nlr family card domain protein n=1 Tax=Haemaphysalis longicornis TaxID=44386 RepID=A0A9J6G6I4_HAELO|nr:hypothetical protein HPB48_020718 [Haemaphysalis longicornis]
MEEISNEDVLDYLGRLPGASITLRQVCTASDGRPCHILDEIPTCNRLLRAVECWLAERTPDKLTLVSEPTDEESSATEDEQRQACALIFWLLKRHRCVNSFEVRIHRLSESSRKSQELIAKSLRTAPSLKRLKITVASCSSAQMQFLSSISFLDQLETLQCTLVNSPEIGSLLRPLFETSMALSSLDLRLSCGTVSYGHDFWEVLATCKALKSMRVAFINHLPTTKDTYLPFFEYLEKTTKLTSVHVALGFGKPSEWLNHVLKALRGNKGLVNVTLDCFIVNIEESIAIKNFLSENSKIRSFQLNECVFGNAGEGLCYYYTDEFGSLTPLILPWLSVLKTNRVLQKLHLNFGGFSPAECAAFLEGVAKNRHLRSVSIEDIDLYCSYWSCQARRNNNSKKGGLLWYQRPEMLLKQCEQVRLIRLEMSTPEDLTWFVTAVLPIEFHHRVTDFTFRLTQVDPTQEGASTIAKFIEESKTLARLELDFECYYNDLDMSQVSAIGTTILKALRRNSSIRDLVLHYPDCTDVDAEELACTIRKSNTICNIEFDLSLNAGEAFLSHLFPSILYNYTILSAYMEDISCLVGSAYWDLLDVTARNERLVARAVTFAAGSSSTACAEAFELASVQSRLGQRIVRSCIRG